MNAVAPIAPAAPAVREPMDRDFIEKNQIVERYLLGKLPPKGVADFERVVRENPALVDEIGLADRVHRAIKLMEAGGQSDVFQEKAKQPWERPGVAAGLAGLALVALVGAGVLLSKLSDANASVERLQKAVTERAIDPATSRRSITIEPSRSGPPKKAMFGIGGKTAELVEMKTDLSWSDARAFRVSIERADQGTVAVLQNVQKDSNGQLRIAVNSSAFGPGTYDVSFEGLNWRGVPSPTAWMSFDVAPGR